MNPNSLEMYIVQICFFRFLRFLGIVAWATLLSWILPKITKRSISRKTRWLSVAAIVLAIHQVISLSDFSSYAGTFQHLSNSAIIISFVSFWLLALSGFCAGIGLILKKELSRKIIIIWSGLNIAAIPLKSSSKVIENTMILFSRFLFEVGLEFNDNMLLFIRFWITAISLGHLLLSTLLIWYFSRKDVIKNFCQAEGKKEII